MLSFSVPSTVSLYSYPPAISAVLSLFLGGFVLSKNPRAALYRVFAGMCFSFFIWLFCYAVVFSLSDPNRALFWSRNSYLGIVFIPVTVHHLASFFAKQDTGNKRLVGLSYLLAVPFLFLSRTDYFFGEVYQYFWGYYPKRGSFYDFYPVYFAFFQGRGLWLLFKASISTVGIQNPKGREQAKYLCFSLAIASLASVDFLPKYGIGVYPCGYIFMLFFVLIVAYAIAAHQIMDIQIVLKKTLFYSFLAFSLSVFYVLVIFILSRSFLFDQITKPTLTNGIVLVLLIALLLKPLEALLHRLLDKKFFRGTIEEISEEREKLQRELERRERLKSAGILAAGMAHEIKNPLTAINTFVSYLPTKYDDPQFREKFSRIVPQELARVKDIVADLLAFSKPSEPKKRKCDPGVILAGVEELLTSEFLKMGIKVCSDFAREAEILADPDQIKQAFLNIVLNAIDAMKAGGGELFLQTRVLGGSFVETIIRDSGQGIPKDKLEHIFDPFYTDKEGGTGLGLAITHSLIEKNGGKITVESDPGQGTLFRIQLSSKI